MIRIIFALVLAVAAAFCVAAEPPLQLADNAPNRHIVVPGDTLWGISGKFLKEPWRWPEIWRMNREQVKNPHRIYPGDIIVLERDADGNPRLSRQSAKLQPQIYSEPVRQTISSIPFNVIGPFLSSPLVIEANGLTDAAQIVATPPNRVYLSDGDLAYVANAEAGIEKWQIYRKGKPLLDPENKELLGYEAYYLGTAKQIQAGDTATFEIITVKEEIGRGDRLIPAGRPPLVEFVPHKPEHAVEARAIGVYGGVNEAGRLSIISFNKGSRDDIEVGHVLALLRNRVVVQRDENGLKETIKIPDERYGLAFVFRTFERISYALVVESNGPVTVNDYLRTP